MRTVAPALLLLSWLSLSASETHPADVRLTLMLNPKTEEVYGKYRFNDNSGTAGDGDNLDIGYRVEVGLVTRLVTWSPNLSLVGGGWVFYADQESSGSKAIGNGSVISGPMSYLTLGIDAYVGIETRFNHIFSMEVGPVVGAGTTRFTDYVRVAGATSGAEETGHGDYIEAGLNLGFLARNPKGSAVFSLGVRYLASYGEADNRFATFQQDVEISQHGFAPYGMVGLTF